MEITSLEIRGYRGLRVPNSFYRQDQPEELGIILPGYRFSADRAELHYAGRVLTDKGADVLKVEYDYPRTDYPNCPELEQQKWVAEDVLAAAEAAFSKRGYEKITLIGKSLGTLAMWVLLGDSRFAAARCIWMTPVLNVEALVRRIEQVKPSSLFIIGTADPYYQPDVLRRLVETTKGRLLLVEGMNHGLEIPGGVSDAMELLKRIVRDVEAFLA